MPKLITNKMQEATMAMLSKFLYWVISVAIDKNCKYNLFSQWPEIFDMMRGQ
jgi:hypothetical protein